VTVPIAPATELMTIMLGRTAFAWTPGGRALVFAGARDNRLHLYVRPIDAPEARELPNTEDARALAISPDGRWVAFWAASPGAPGVIKKVPLAGGPAMTLASGVGLREPPWGLTWSDTGRLFFAAQASTLDGIWEVLPDGSTKAVLRLAEGELQHALPFALPGGNTLLYTVRKHSWSWGGEQVVALTLATGARKVILNDAIDARYVPTGHLLFLRMGALYAVPFDPVRLEVIGKEAPVLDPVAQALTTGASGNQTGAGQFAVSPSGALAYVQSPIVPWREARIVALDRRGQVMQFEAPARSFSNGVRVSPDGKRIAVGIRTLTDVGLWIYDFDSTRLNLFAGGEEVSWTLWSRDAKSLYYLRIVNGRFETVVRAFDGSAPRRFVNSGIPSSLTPDGRQLVIVYNQDIFTLDLDDEKAARRPLIADPKVVESWPEFSPDGRWLAYASERSGRPEVYVRPYPGPGADEQVSVDGGDSPAWNPNGREIFFVSLANTKGQRTMMSSAFRAGSAPGRPQRLFEYDTRAFRIASRWLRAYDVAPNGERFYALQVVPVEPLPPVTHISLILNWFEELKAKVAAGGAK
jgi:serine/threonine-protein kinase